MDGNISGVSETLPLPQQQPIQPAAEEQAPPEQSPPPLPPEAGNNVDLLA